jgi:hypothetical protein
MASFTPARALAGALVLLLAGCSHTFYQFHIDAAEQGAILSNRNALAAGAAGQNDVLASAVDLNGRRAVETLLASMTVEQTNADVQYQRLVHALYLGVLADGEDPLGALDADVTTIAARVAQRAVGTGLEQMGLGGIAEMVGIGGDDDGQRLGEMQASLARANIGTCDALYPIISYNAGILGHIRSQLAENDPAYLEWRGRVRAIHLVRFDCQTGHVLMLLGRNAGEDGVRAIGWTLLSPAQWQALEPRLRYALDLPS